LRVELLGRLDNQDHGTGISHLRRLLIE